MGRQKSITKRNSTIKNEKNHKERGSVTFDHHAQQLTIRTNRTWRSPSPQPSSHIGMPITTQVQVTEEYSAAVNDDMSTRGLEVSRIAMKTRSGSGGSCSLKDEEIEPDHEVTTVDFTMQFP